MSKLQGAEHNKKGRGLEYQYLNVHDEDRDGESTWVKSELDAPVMLILLSVNSNGLFSSGRPYTM